MSSRSSRWAAIDAEFAKMKGDAAFQAEAVQVAEDFAEADWEAWRVTERSSGSPLPTPPRSAEKP